jgi:hypothetical protein
MKFETEVVNIEKMGRRKRYEASEQQEYKEAKIVSGGHMDGSKRSRPDLTSTIPNVPAAEQQFSTNETQIA